MVTTLDLGTIVRKFATYNATNNTRFHADVGVMHQTSARPVQPGLDADAELRRLRCAPFMTTLRKRYVCRVHVLHVSVKHSGAATRLADETHASASVAGPQANSALSRRCFPPGRPLLRRT